MIPTISKPITEGKNSAAKYNIADCVVDCPFQTAILKIDVTEHFSIFLLL